MKARQFSQQLNPKTKFNREISWCERKQQSLKPTPEVKDSEWTKIKRKRMESEKETSGEQKFWVKKKLQKRNEAQQHSVEVNWKVYSACVESSCIHAHTARALAYCMLEICSTIIYFDSLSPASNVCAFMCCS